MESVTSIMHLADKFDIPKCLSQCVQFFKDALAVGNIFIVMNLAIRYDQQELLQMCEKVIAVNITEIFKLNGFLKCEQQAIAQILSLNVLSCSEVEVFEACLAWVRAQSGGNDLTKALFMEYLVESYHEIRFKSMTNVEFCMLALEYAAVLDDDFKEIINMITLPDFQAEQFNNDPRQPQFNEIAVIVCNRVDQEYLNDGGNDNIDSYELDETDCTTFKSTHCNFILGQIVFAQISSESGEPFTPCFEIEIMEADTVDGDEIVLLTQKTTADDLNETVVPLERPVLVRRNKWYRICCKRFHGNIGYLSVTLTPDVRIGPNNEHREIIFRGGSQEWLDLCNVCILTIFKVHNFACHFLMVFF